MANLFSIFDPASPNSFSANWSSSLLFLLLVPAAQWSVSARYNKLFMQLKLYLFNEFKPLVKKSSAILLMVLGVLMFILFNNVMGLLPYVFTASSHLSFSLTFGLVAWFSLMLYGWLFNYQNLLVHLIPQGTPSLLMPLMVVIESISNIIRPMTLAVRLSANMIAGHLLLSLLSSALSAGSFIVSPLLGAAVVALVGLECAVAVIQSYVFSVLLTLYSAEFSD